MDAEESIGNRQPIGGLVRRPERQRPRGGPGASRGSTGTAYRIRTDDLRLERAVSWASRRMRRGSGRLLDRPRRIAAIVRSPQPRAPGGRASSPVPPPERRFLNTPQAGACTRDPSRTRPVGASGKARCLDTPGEDGVDTAFAYHAWQAGAATRVRRRPSGTVCARGRQDAPARGAPRREQRGRWCQSEPGYSRCCSRNARSVSATWR